MITRSVYVDTAIYREGKKEKNKVRIPRGIMNKCRRVAERIWMNVGINPDDFIIDQKVIIRNYLIKKRNGYNKIN